MINLLRPNFCVMGSDFQKRILGLQDNLMSFALRLTSNYDDANDLAQ